MDGLMRETSDVIHLTYEDMGSNIFYPDSDWIENRNSELRMALGWEYGEGNDSLFSLFCL